MPVRKEKIEKKRLSQDKNFVRSNGAVVKNPTSKNAWKGFERVVAEFFGTKRVPLSGSNSGHGTNSDTLSKDFYVECKFRNKFSIFALFKDTESKAKVEGKLPIVAVKQKNERGYLLVIRPEDLQQIAALLKKKKNGTKDKCTPM